MANLTDQHPWVIDTASATAITSDQVTLAKLRWVSPAAHATPGTDRCVVQNAAGKVIWESAATAADFVDESLFLGDGARDGQSLGLKVTTLSSGKLYVYFQ